jgi:biotin carboxyl carrier protein
MKHGGGKKSGASDARSTAAKMRDLAGSKIAPVDFWNTLIAAECLLGQAAAGALLRSGQNETVAILAVQPKISRNKQPPKWIQQCAQIIRENPAAERSIISRIEGQPEASEEAPTAVVIIPKAINGLDGVCAAFLCNESDPKALERSCRKFEFIAQFTSFLQTAGTPNPMLDGLTRLKKAMQIITSINMEHGFKSAAMAFCNEIASQWQCERASLGFMEGKYVKLKAMSNTENFIRKMRLVQDIEFAMEECADQDTEILYPAEEEHHYVNRATASMSKRHGPVNVLSLPLRMGEKVRAVLTLERPTDRGFSAEEVEALRLICELCPARLIDLYDNDTWLPAGAGEKWRRLLRGLAEPRHTSAKVAAIIIFAVLMLICFGKGIYKAEAPFTIEATYQQVIPAPFDGFIKSVEVEPGDLVEHDNTILASLDTTELRLQLLQAEADRAAYMKQASASMRDGETAQAQIAQANADKAEAEARLLRYQIGRANLQSPISGKVVKGDLKKQVGAPVKTGDLLFEIAPLELLRAELMIPEDQAFDIEIGQKGFLATFSYPSERIEFEILRINPVAEVVNQRNIFKTRVGLQETPDWLRPGMEGVAKIHVGKRPQIWIWSRKVINWIRMKLWI